MVMKRKLWATLAVLAAFAFGLATTACRNPANVEPPEPANIVLSVTEAHGFGPVYVGYEAITPITVTVTNTGGPPTGALTVALEGEDYDSFTVNPATLPGIPAGEYATFAVGPDHGLAVGVHTAGHGFRRIGHRGQELRRDAHGFPDG